ncbi:MAG TPA: BON domain-containing protein [Polyangia bacterium]|nr:BON domain-containing protein [Polyangia bacterium]
MKNLSVYLLVGSLGLVSVGACSHGKTAQAARETREEASDSLASAYDAARAGGQTVKHSGEYAVDRTEDGAVRFARKAKKGFKKAGNELSDAYITGKVKAKLAADPGVEASAINVDTDGGVVTLRGEVPNRDAALRAVRDTLGTDGVTEVRSMLDWPQASMGGREQEGTRK